MPFRASQEDWETIKRWAEDSTSERCILELRYRVAALEARADTPSAPAATPRPDVPSDEELWELRRAAQQGRTSMENWITRAEIHANRALFDAGVEWATRRAEHQPATEESSAPQPAPADPDAPQTLHSVALDHVDTLGRSFHILPDILATLRRAIREPMVTPPEPGKVATDEELRSAWASAYDAAEYGHGYRDEMRFVDGLRGVHNLGRRHGAPACPHVRSNSATNWCALAEQQAPAKPTPEPAPPAPTGKLVEEIKGLLGHYGDSSARAAINVVAEWLERRSSSPTTELDSITYGVHLLRQEATR